MQPLSWSMFNCWNSQVGVREEHPLVERDYLYASELGGSFIDRWLKMKGTVPTNPPNMRSMRKFQTGNLFEWVVEQVLRQAGILQDRQERLEFQYPGLLRVSGRLDFIAGGKPDWDRAAAEVAHFPPTLQHMSVEVVKDLRERFGDDELKSIVIEVKSVASQMFSRYEGEHGKPSPQHAMQIFHYLKCTGMDEGHLLYVSKDDLLMAEFGIFNPGPWEPQVVADISAMTAHWNAGQRPDPEPLIKFENFRFSTNWKVEYSSYLTLIYGYDEPIQYRDAWGKLTASWTRVFKRCVAGANMTKANLDIIAQAKQKFGSWDTLVDQARAAAATDPSILQEDPE